MIQIVLVGVLGFFVALFVQAALWRLLRIRREMLALALIFIAAPMAAYIGAWAFASGADLSLFMSALLHLALSAGYIQTYPALREDIPSVSLLFAIRDRPGLKDTALIASMTANDRLLGQKLEDLRNDGLIVDDDSVQRLTPAGRMLAFLFHYYRKLLGIQRDQG